MDKGVYPGELSALGYASILEDAVVPWSDGTLQSQLGKFYKPPNPVEFTPMPYPDLSEPPVRSSSLYDELGPSYTDTLAVGGSALGLVPDSSPFISLSSYDLSPSSTSPPLPADLLYDRSQLKPAVPKLTAAQKGELELAKIRAQRAYAGRNRKNKRKVEEAEESKDEDASDVDFTRLNPDDQEAYITAKLQAADNEKEARRLKRLLRNRASAQQARERKKQYLTNLEEQIKAYRDTVNELDGKVKALSQENAALKRIISSTRAGTNDLKCPTCGLDSLGALYEDLHANPVL